MIYDLIIYFRFKLYVLDGRYEATYNPVTAGWFHIVLNYLGPNEDEGIRGYFNGVEGLSASAFGGSGRERDPTGDGRIVIGRQWTDRNRNYGGIQVDEMMFFNQTLDIVEIQAILNAV